MNRTGKKGWSLRRGAKSAVSKALSLLLALAVLLPLCGVGPIYAASNGADAANAPAAGLFAARMSEVPPTEEPPAEEPPTEEPPTEEPPAEEPPAEAPPAEAPPAEQPAPEWCEHHTAHTEACGYLAPSGGAPCAHVHDDACGYAQGSPGTPCGHTQHDESCGYEAPLEGAPCGFVCSRCVTGWQWQESEGFLVWNDDAQRWGLSLPGVSAASPLSRDALAGCLPQAVFVRTAASAAENGMDAVPLHWELSALPETMTEGDYLLTATLQSEAFRLAAGVPAPEVLLELGGGEALAGTTKMKFLNQWTFVDSVAQDKDGEQLWGTLDINDANTNNVPLPSNSVTVPIANLAGGKSRDEVISQIMGTVLPKGIRGWVSSGGTTGEILRGMNFSINNKCTQTAYACAASGWAKPSYAVIWGSIGVNWSTADTRTHFFPNDQIVFTASVPTSTDAGGTTYALYVNSNRMEDHLPGGNKDTQTRPDLLCFTVTLEDMEQHIVAPASPKATVNLFDYWVSVKTPAADTGGDLILKNDWHYHELDGTGDQLANSASLYANEDAWYQGINQGHLLLFGDGMIHAGLWNKGAGENCRYGKNYAGMEQIVQPVLDANGYPALNLALARKILNDVPQDQPNSRDHRLIKDYALTGDHDGKPHSPATPDHFAYSSNDIQNLSNTLISLWKSGNGVDPDTPIEACTESLQYLFDPAANTPNREDYENVTGLFQLDEHGYYFYNMRENFAEFDPVQNRFVLYDAPAALRTDGKAGLGNFFPFNKAEEVFDSVGANGKLGSSVPCSNNAMNHHLGMTVEVDFLQPNNGQIEAGGILKPMTFEFSGDDDVWIFIDGVLVLDLGGIHSELYGTIDFHTGNVYVGRAFGVPGIPEVPSAPDICVTQTTLRSLFDEAGEAGRTQWKGETFSSGTSHTLKMFYLERGNYDSSLALRFNLQTPVYEMVRKVDQNGDPVRGVEFELYEASDTLGGGPVTAGTPGAIECLYTDEPTHGGKPFYVVQTGSVPLLALSTGEGGYAQFTEPDGSFFNFPDLGERYYILKEAKTPQGYRSPPVDVVLHYSAQSAALSVANRWTTGAHANSMAHIQSTGGVRYLAGSAAPSNINEILKNGLVVAVPLLYKESEQSWITLYGSNLGGFQSTGTEGQGDNLLRAVLMQAAEADNANWYFNWDADNSRLNGVLSDMPGLSGRYLGSTADMRIAYAVLTQEALARLGISAAGTDAAVRYAALCAAMQSASVQDTLAALAGVPGGFLRLDPNCFSRTFRSVVDVPNERRELQIWKVDQDGRGVNGAVFGLYRNAECTDAVTQGTTATVEGRDGVLIFGPSPNGTGYAEMKWANAIDGNAYYLKELGAPAGHTVNDTVIPVYVGYYSIYADAGRENDGVRVLAGAGRLTQTMIQYALDNEVDITLRDIIAYMQTQPSGGFSLTGWQNACLSGAGEGVRRSMDLHHGLNAGSSGNGYYGLHDVDGGTLFQPFFSTDTGFVRAQIQQNYPALDGSVPKYIDAKTDANKDDLGDTDLTNLFSLRNIVVVTDPTVQSTGRGMLTVRKQLAGEGLAAEDLTELFPFRIELIGPNGEPLNDQTFDYYSFYGDDKVGQIRSGETLLLHHDEAVTILGLPEGARYAVTETAAGGWIVRPDSGTVSGEIAAGQASLAEFINSRRPVENNDPNAPGGPDAQGDPAGPDGRQPGAAPDTGDIAEPWAPLAACSLLAFTALGLPCKIGFKGRCKAWLARLQQKRLS